MTLGSHGYDDLRARLDERIAAHDKPGAVAAALTAVDSGGVGVQELYAMLCVLLVDLGSEWQAGTRAVWEEHLATGVVRTIVEALYPRLERPTGSAGGSGTVLLACPQDESHDLGLRMLSDRFEMAGWCTHLLGADTPAGDIAAAAAALDVDLVVLSASTHFHRVGIRALLDDLHAALPDTRIVVGGAAFTHDCCGLQDEEVMQPEELLDIRAGAAPDNRAG